MTNLEKFQKACLENITKHRVFLKILEKQHLPLCKYTLIFNAFVAYAKTESDRVQIALDMKVETENEGN